MIKKIFRSTFLANLLVLLVTVLLMLGTLYRYFTHLQLEQLQTQTTLAAQGVSQEGLDYFEQVQTPTLRMTWVDNQGTVLYDTQEDASQMENHAKREEIASALQNGYGQSQRYSSTLTKTSLYAAQRLTNGTVLRLSVTQDSIWHLLLGLTYPIGLTIFLAVILSLLGARYTAKRIVAPLNHLNLEQPLNNQVDEEISPLLRRIDKQQQELLQQEQLLAEKKKQFDTIISKIREGLLLLDTRLNVVSINTAAAELFHLDATGLGKNLLEIVRDRPLHQLLEHSLSGQKADGLLTRDDRQYKVLSRPIFSDGQVSGLVVLLFDITEQWQSEQLRREFTANVSHELKTPLQIMSGYSEMMSNPEMSKSDMHYFSEKIYREAQRMIKLIEDVIHLSQLDESPQLDVQQVDLYQLAKENLDRLTAKATDKNIHLQLKGNATPLYGNPALLSSIIYNLCDNAITYNKENGQVVVSVTEHDGKVFLTVEDTGIGIAKDQQERIFERFYRVDKSRSKKVGGTGLGLSIVKHALKQHQATLTIDSQLGQGTSVTVSFDQAKS